MSPDDRTRLRHMAEAIDAALRFAQDQDRVSLDDDQKLEFALVRAVEIVGEAASKISSEGRAELPTIPWSEIVGTRNRLIHAYFSIDRDILWTTVTKALPDLRSQLAEVLGE